MIIWPNNKRFAATLSFDLDAESSWESSSLNGRRLSLLSMGAYGRRVAVPRLLDLLERYSIQAQFYIPGRIAEIDPEVVRSIAKAGHGIGCHGFFHERVDEMNPAENLIILRDSKNILEQTIDREVCHYRAPLWEITPDVVQSLIDLGFHTDSSLMGDDRPYLVGGPEQSLLELPVSWLLDDFEQFAYSAEPAVGGVIEEPDKVYRMWAAELAGMREFGSHFMLTMHPEVIGRPSRLMMLENLIQLMRSQEDLWFCTPDSVYSHWKAGNIELPLQPY
ncbi:polysaccharide deacetylase [Pseudomonas sp. RtIB026]|uniref:polysaccharide deacetylase family protein n=1 Tax=Pseudomonas sp. RtIB026 TaxID=2749999 RepID=UPI0019448E09|nr:polysaccharide deacetylase [Pseudomonas sp. RtIB026]BCJ06796.1 polysaccharide deacetylase [Pseudomonas sp. RtIB026]